MGSDGNEYLRWDYSWYGQRASKQHFILSKSFGYEWQWIWNTYEHHLITQLCISFDNLSVWDLGGICYALEDWLQVTCFHLGILVAKQSRLSISITPFLHLFCKLVFIDRLLNLEAENRDIKKFLKRHEESISGSCSSLYVVTIQVQKNEVTKGMTM